MSAAPATPTSGPLLRDRGWYHLAILLGLAAMVALALLLGLGAGTIRLSPGQVVDGLMGPASGPWHRVIVDIRLPRLLLAALVGASLAVSGTLLQAVMGNPLADPGIIGISSGAGLAGMAVLLVFPAALRLVTPVAFLGAMAAAVLIYALAWRGGMQPLRIVLAGVAVSTLCGAGISAIMVLHSDRVQGALLFMNGSLSLKSWGDVGRLWPWSLVALASALVAARRLDVLVLGDHVARGMGMNVQANRLFFTAVAALLAASSVSAVGLLGFVGLIVPHIMRLLLGTRHATLVPGALLAGAALVMASDTVSRTIASPLDLPVGIAMAALGVPFFLFLLRRGM